ncbi:hypothetical protein H5410_047036 [Solanum commersonii]|uniref:DUF4283 domain-containing protein n=1 Tax=Solanum commersonii TaxID=4109 RepID=A0A9J5XG22_SOLCO|nr:hypothetical protein H5410_047036 [Solanum commersonii]
MWNLEFKPEEETPIVPSWITLPKLPWHCYYTLTPILSPIGKALYLDSASMQKLGGHFVGTCPMKTRDKEFKQRKEMEASKKGHDKQQSTGTKNNQPHEEEERTRQTTK